MFRYEGAILITNDRHFDKIKVKRIIEAWNLSKTVKKLL